jgi:acetyl esterase/lipase
MQGPAADLRAAQKEFIIMSEVSDRVRRMFREGDEKRDAGLTSPEDVDRFDDIAYGSDPVWQKLDVYRPKEAMSAMPVILSVHGGGWVYGDKERYQYYCLSLAQRGFAVVNFSYRLAPEHKFPAQLEDTNLVAGWIMKNADNYGMDLQRIFAVGDSAGASILGSYASILTNPEYAASYGFRAPAGFALRAIALNCGVYHVLADDPKDRQTTQLLKEFLPQGGSPEELEKLHLEKHVTENFPPTFIMTATGDFLKRQLPEMTDCLLAREVPHTARFYTAVHGKQPLGHVFHVNMKLEEARLCNDEECAFFREFF